ncbi:MAG: phenylalanine--tRNA ligase subunit beta [Candidatus Pacebacteria bacterium]|nr:phenylalanine--tRNA ligase subunit beta [Candidatus Paceibacterota bacterium]MBP9832141.1 phenylalanine--tRNA ligase subunit beta [Candidatus Paceibacterota bacterium]
MKVSTAWLQKYFDAPLPSAKDIADALTFHAFEIEDLEEVSMDVKVLPNRAADCLSHRGVAKEISAILNLPLKSDPLRAPIPEFPKTDTLMVTADPAYTLRHTGALVRGVTVGPSPEWLKSALESVGQRSINNVVDVLNYVLLDIGQPSGAFDLAKIKDDNGVVKVDIRRAKAGEKIKVLTGEEYTLTEDMFAFTDAVGGSLLDIAGIKGGFSSGVTSETKDLFISAGNYDGTLIRKASQKLKLFTDASQRFQNRPSPELTVYGMQAILSLIKQVAGGEVVGVVDIRNKPQDTPIDVSVTLDRINQLLGSGFLKEEVADVFKRLDLSVSISENAFTITPPFERTDLKIPEDLIEEVGRVLGYDRVPRVEPTFNATPDQARYRGIERMKDMLVEEGFVEVSTQSFSKKGDIYLANPLDKTMPALRPSLGIGVQDALARGKQYQSLLLSPGEKLKLFEVGTVFPKAGEYVELRMTERVSAWGEGAGTVDNLSIAKLEDYGKDYTPKKYELGMYKPFSVYPFIVRDIALWAPEGTDVGLTKSHIMENAGPLLVRCELFDTFSKDGRTSYAFRLVFQADDKTLTDDEVGEWMDSVTKAVTQKNWEVR